jgi:hypothetical protein
VEFLQQAKENAVLTWAKENQDTGEDDSQSNTSSKLFRSVIRKSRMAHGYCMLANIETAAAHLMYLVNQVSLQGTPSND